MRIVQLYLLLACFSIGRVAWGAAPSADFRVAPGTAGRPGAETGIAWISEPSAALQRAKSEGKPILLYAAPEWSYWSRRMERETFADAKVAQAVSSKTVPLKLDADLRPDVATRYLNRGYPITAFLTETGRVIASAQTIEKEHMLRLLDSLEQVYREHAGSHLPPPSPLRSEGAGTNKHPGSASPPSKKSTSPGTKLTPKQVKSTLEEWLKKEFDRANGGFGRGGKILPFESLEWSLHEAATTRVALFEEMAVRSIQGVLDGTIYDSSRGLFHRTSRDNDWNSASTEVLLDDQARMTRTLLFAYQVTEKAEFLKLALKSVDYMNRDLWSPGEQLFTFGRAGRAEVVPSRTPPANDGPMIHATLTGANLRAARALLYAHLFSPKAGHLGRAKGVIRRIETAGWRRGQGIQREIRKGKGAGIRYLEDQVEWAFALLDLYQQTADPALLQKCEEFLRRDLNLFAEGHAFADIPAADRAGLVPDVRFPIAENAQIYLILQSIATLTGDFTWRDQADRLFDWLVGEATTLLTAKGAVGTELGLPLVGLAILRHEEEAIHLAIVSPKDHPEGKRMIERAFQWPRPVTLVQALDPSTGAGLINRLGYESSSKPSAYICQGLTCLSTVENAQALDAFRKELTHRAMKLQSTR